MSPTVLPRKLWQTANNTAEARNRAIRRPCLVLTCCCEDALKAVRPILAWHSTAETHDDIKMKLLALLMALLAARSAAVRPAMPPCVERFAGRARPARPARRLRMQC